MFEVLLPDPGDLRPLTDNALITAIQNSSRAAAAADARASAAVAELVRRRVVDEHPDWACDDWDVCAAEVACALTVSHGRASGLMDDAITMRDRMPLVGRAHLAGRFSARAVGAICNRTALVADPAAQAAIDAELADAATRFGPLSQYKLEKAIDAIVARHDRAAVRRSRNALQGRNFTIGDRNDENGTASVWGRLSGADPRCCTRPSDRWLPRCAPTTPAPWPSAVPMRSARWPLAPPGCPAGAVIPTASQAPVRTRSRPASWCTSWPVPQRWPSRPIQRCTAVSTSNWAPPTSIPTGTTPRRAGLSTRIPTVLDPARVHRVHRGRRFRGGGQSDGDAGPGAGDAGGASSAPAARPHPAAAALIPGLPRGGLLSAGLLADLIARGATVRVLDVPAACPGYGYRLSATLDRFVRARDVTCRFPGCDHPAASADIDHTVPWQAGATHPSNAKSYCRKHYPFNTVHRSAILWATRVA